MAAVPSRSFIEFPVVPLEHTATLDLPMNDEDVARSERNILEWMSYLPEDCIKTMIAMGWDVTT